ncbi:geranylgeranyl diphosphate reductase [Rhodopila globiformis]|uniref:geranylgeranyl diphosphate reductase n=1 Tax=Rhodopila globiformis TaxID=1071 RepID=A0A2S6MZV6_RHOGL|nr:geranylgeranyl diphosphate reductase [Rhodopila globiformis]PPQ27907.1 geranylgeranyl diphosphate reductase [Rhodopila globiformis]
MELTYDAVVVGGGPAGATAATELARRGRKVALLDRAGRIKPCGGAIPPRAIRDFGIPDSLICARITSARMIAPSEKGVDMPIQTGGYVGMVNRDQFDEWLRERAAKCGAERVTGTFETLTRDADGVAVVNYHPKGADKSAAPLRLRARLVIGADGAKSAVARQCIKGADKMKYVFAYHEIIRTPETDFDGARCDVYYQGRVSPDFYGWVFPHGATSSVGSGSMHKGFSLRQSVGRLREIAGLDKAETIRGEGAPIPLKPLKRWDNGKDVLVAGDAAGVVAPASGEGIYYALECGRIVGDAGERFLATGDATVLQTARQAFMKDHGRVFWILGMMQWFWYSSDKRRERFVSMCADPDVQRLTWESYMNKKLTRRDPMAHVKIFFKDVAHLLGLVDA